MDVSRGNAARLWHLALWTGLAASVAHAPALAAAPVPAAAPASPAPASPASATSAPAIQPVMSCEALARTGLADLDARITATARVVRNGHGFCDTRGIISPVTRFEMLLPLQTWRGRYLQQGCGGFCGHVDVSLDDPARTSGYQAPFAPLADGEMVVAADDQGHETATNGDGLWGRTDLQLRAVFGYSSEHQLARTARALIHAFYGRGPAHAYFSGVSDGGHEALVLAQRYPADFDGILAGAPGNNWAPLAGLFEPWVVASNRDPQGRQILPAEKLPALHAAVMAACADRTGVIEDPRRCTFDPATLRCPAGADQTGCLSDEQVAAVRKVYRGPTDASGQSLFDGGEPYGSELAWSKWLVLPAAASADPMQSYAAPLALDYLNDLAFWPNNPTRYTFGNLVFTAAMHRKLQTLGGLYNADDPDLGAFRARGGKLIIFHGWADQAIPPFATIDYYRAVIDHMGGYAATQSFSRLYMIPGLYHCPCGQPVDGDPATGVQLLPQLVDWVEDGQAPGSLAIPVTAQTTGNHLDELHVVPVDPAALAAPKNAGLNSNYRYVGARSDYQAGRALWVSRDLLSRRPDND